MKRFLACLFSVGLVGATATFDANAQAIGFVNMERVLQESKPAKDAQDKLSEKFGPKQQEFGEREQEIRKQQAELERDKPLMSKAQVEKKEATIKERIAKFEADLKSVQEELGEAQKKEGQRILEPARKAVEKVAKRKKLGAVFETSQASQAGLVFMGESADITDAVIKAME